MVPIKISELIHIDQGNDDNYNFIITHLKSRLIYENSEVIRLSEDDSGIQRFLNENRANNIANYCETENAIFPTPIIVSLNTDFIKEETKDYILFQDDRDIYEEVGKPFSIIDGQHRLEGITRYHRRGGNKEFDIPLIIYKDSSQVTAASIFVTINANQKSVDQSTIYQLFGIIYGENSDSNKYTVQSFSAKIVQILNATTKSPFFQSIKMLGKRQDNKQFISQGTVAKKISERISSNFSKDNLDIEKGNNLVPNGKKVFRDYFINNNFKDLAVILIVFFSAFSNVFFEMWNDDREYITKKAVGFSTLMKLLDHIFISQKGEINYAKMTQIFQDMKNQANYYDNQNGTQKNTIEDLFNSSASSESVADDYSKVLIEIYDTINNSWIAFQNYKIFNA